MERKSFQPRSPGPSNPQRGRGSTINPRGRFERLDVEADDEHRDPEEEPAHPETLYLRDSSKSAMASNDSPDIGFNFSLNPYRGCQHGCSYCCSGDTAVSIADGSTREIASLKPGDEILGTTRIGDYRRYKTTRVLAHWETRKLAYRVTLEDGTEVVASGDHRLLTTRGWKYVANVARAGHRPHLGVSDVMMGFGASGQADGGHEDNHGYRRGYLCGVVRGREAAAHRHARSEPATLRASPYGLASIEGDVMRRTASYLADYGVGAERFTFRPSTDARWAAARTVATRPRQARSEIHELTAWPSSCSLHWSRGFLAGLFDAGGGCQDGILRISGADHRALALARESLRLLRFGFVEEVKTPAHRNDIHSLRVTGGPSEHLRFFRTTTPAITRNREIAGRAVRSQGRLRVVEIEPLGRELRMYDITTGTEDFIANGVVSHNCYARPTHEYLGFSAGLDFETKIMVKEDAPELLRKELAKKSWEPQVVMLSGVTDCYQPIERKLRITRRCLEVLVEARNPVSVITKNHLITRDIDLFAELAALDACSTHLSIPTLDPELARVLEPRASVPSRRLHAIEMLAKAGIPVGVMVAPVIPGLTDHEIPHILAAAAQAGASGAGWVMLRLPFGVKDVFEQWLLAHRPDRAERVLSRVRDTRDGKLYDAEFGVRGRGTGKYAEQIKTLFDVSMRRAGLVPRHFELSTAAFRPPRSGPQMKLF